MCCSSASNLGFDQKYNHFDTTWLRLCTRPPWRTLVWNFDWPLSKLLLGKLVIEFHPDIPIVLQLNSQWGMTNGTYLNIFTIKMKNPRGTGGRLLAKDCEKIEYPKPDGVYSFDLLENLARSLLANDPTFAVMVGVTVTRWRYRCFTLSNVTSLGRWFNQHLLWVSSKWNGSRDEVGWTTSTTSRPIWKSKTSRGDMAERYRVKRCAQPLWHTDADEEEKILESWYYSLKYTSEQISTNISLHEKHLQKDDDCDSTALCFPRHVPLEVSLPTYDGPEGRFCPAKVYEFLGSLNRLSPLWSGQWMRVAL